MVTASLLLFFFALPVLLAFGRDGIISLSWPLAFPLPPAKKKSERDSPTHTLIYKPNKRKKKERGCELTSLLLLCN